MNRYFASANFVVSCLLIFAPSPQVYALQNCSDLLQDHINWANRPDINPMYPNKGESYRVGLTKMTNSNNRKFASFTEATLDLTNPNNPTGELVGTGTTWFSDRRTHNNQPFSGKADELKITLSKHADPLKINAKLELLSWGGVQDNFEAQCANGHIYAFKTDHHGTHLVDITLSKVKKVTSEVCVDFEPPLVQGTKYGAPAGHVSGGLAFTSNGILVTVWDFISTSGTSLFDFAGIATPRRVFGSGQSIQFNNINLEFDFSKLDFQVSQVQFKFLDQGGLENIAVNGSHVFAGELSSAPNPIGGVNYTIMTDPPAVGGKSGTMILNGAIQKLKIGGQEFWIDQVCARDY